jgi:methyl-accepting chemotaxis protein
MSNRKIAHQLFALVAVLMVAFVIAIFFQIRETSQSLYDARFGLLRSQVESAISILDRYYKLQESGQMTQDEAQAEAFRIINDIRFKPAGYIFGYNFNVVQTFHPTSPEDVGKDVSGDVDKMGNYFSKEMVAKAKAGGGRTIYYWTKPGQSKDQVTQKGSYSAAFEPWQLVVASGVYFDDLNAQIQTTIWNAVMTCGLIGAGGLFAAYWFILGISRPLKDVHNALQAVADEDTTVDIPHVEKRNEIGMMAKATFSLQQKVRERHAMSTRERAQQQALDSEREKNQQLQENTAAAQAHVVATIGLALEVVAKGDLTTRCGHLGERYATLRTNFNNALHHLEAAMIEVSTKSRDIDLSKEEIRRASNELSQRTERQAANLEETSAALDELTIAVRQTADGALEAANRVSAVSKEAHESDVIVSRAI